MNQEHTFDFRGRAGEWFGIWIVNLLLSIVTIGIYSAWAKVRRLKYFYNNTYFDGRNFDYHATGKQILIGRLIFIGGYIALTLITSVAPIVGGLLFLAVIAAIPWLIVRGMKFNARVTSFSNVRFDFHGRAGRAFVVMLLLPLGFYLLCAALIVGGVVLMAEMGANAMGVPLIALGALLIPVGFAVVDRAMKLFSITNHALGHARFDLKISLKPFLLAQIAAVAWVIFVFAVGAVAVGLDIEALGRSFSELEGDAPSGEAVMIVVMFYIMVFAAFIPAASIYTALVRNAVYSAASLEGGTTFRSDINPGKYFWIAFSNLVIVVCTLGLMLPWAQIRMTRYLAQHTHGTPGMSLDDFEGEAVAAGSALGDAYADFEAVDVGLPV